MLLYELISPKVQSSTFIGNKFFMKSQNKNRITSAHLSSKALQGILIIMCSA